MAIKQVVLLTCDRCGREEQLEESSYDEDSKREAAFEVRYGDDEVSFSDLCNRCRERLSKIMKSIKLEKDEEESEGAPRGPIAGESE